MDGTGTDALPPRAARRGGLSGDRRRRGGRDELLYALHDSGSCCALGADGLGVRDRAAWPKGRNNVEITYSHGYADADFPRSVRMVAVRLAARFYQQPSGVVLWEPRPALGAL